MWAKYYFLSVLLFYKSAVNTKEVVCPDYCDCDDYQKFRRATCQNKMLVSVEIGMPPEVDILDLSFNQVSELGNKVFVETGLTNLQSLNLSHNKIGQIHMFTFEGLEKLKTLDLSYNMIQYFTEQWFVNLKNLNKLYLGGNNLVTINKQPRISLPHLKVLVLSDCKIEHLNDDILSALPSLELLDISHNYFEQLKVDLILPLKNLQLLRAEKNHLHCKDNEMLHLKQYLKKTNIDYIGPCKGKKHSRISPAPTESGNLDNKNNADGNTDVEGDKTKRNITEKEKNDSNVSLTTSEKLGKSIPTQITSKLETIDDAEVLDDLEKSVNSHKSQKMILDPSKSTAKSKIATNVNEVETSKPEISDAVTLHKRNSWTVDEQQPNIAVTPEVLVKTKIEYIEVCNGTVQYNSGFDKWIRDFIHNSPTVILVLGSAAGGVLGILIAHVIPLPVLKQKLPIILKVILRRTLAGKRKRGRNNKNDDDGGATESENNKNPADPEDDNKEGDIEKTSASKNHARKKKPVVVDDIYELVPKKNFSKIATTPETLPEEQEEEDLSLLLGNEEDASTSTPLLGKKSLNQKDDED